MKFRLLAAVFVFAAASALIANRVTAQSKGASATGQQPDAEQMKAMMEGMQKYMEGIKPGKHHEPLNHFVGSWETTTKMWWGGPGTDPIVTKGTSEIKWVLGGRFVLDEHKGKMMMPDMSGSMKEIDYEGIGLMGYNNERNIYEQTWVSSAGTNMLTMKGAFDSTGKVLALYGE